MQFKVCISSLPALIIIIKALKNNTNCLINLLSMILFYFSDPTSMLFNFKIKQNAIGPLFMKLCIILYIVYVICFHSRISFTKSDSHSSQPTQYSQIYVRFVIVKFIVGQIWLVFTT